MSAKKHSLSRSPPPQLAKLTAKFRDLSLRREVLLNDYTKEHPEVDAVDAELANVAFRNGKRTEVHADHNGRSLAGLGKDGSKQHGVRQWQFRTVFLPSPGCAARWS